jgi:hypothetical protein
VNGGYHPKIRLAAVKRLAKVQEAKKAREVLKQEIKRLAEKRDPKKSPIHTPVQAPLPVIPLPLPIQKIEHKNPAPVEQIKTETIKAKAKPKPAAPPTEGEFEKMQYHALLAGRFRSGQVNPSGDRILRQQCDIQDLAEIDTAYINARRKIKAGRAFDNTDCADERNILRIWINEPGRGRDGLNRLTAEGKIADAYWKRTRSPCKNCENLPTT